MFHYTYLRVALILLYFTLCSACGGPPEEAETDPGDTTPQATDINYVGGGTQAPDTIQEPPPYDSPFISADPTPTSFVWVGDIRQAITMVQDDRSLRILVWFENRNCTECNTIKSEIFTDEDVLKSSRNWLFVLMDTERDRNQSDYMLGDADPPAVIMLDSSGNEYRRYIGTFDKEQFLTMLRDWR